MGAAISCHNAFISFCVYEIILGITFANKLLASPANSIADIVYIKDIRKLEKWGCCCRLLSLASDCNITEEYEMKK